MSNRAELVRDTRLVARLCWDVPAQTAPVPHAALAAVDHDAALAEAERRSFATGYAKGEEAGLQRVKDHQRRLAETIAQLESLRSVIIHEAEGQLVRLATAVAGCVLRREISTDRSLLLAIARAAIDRLGESPQAVVHLNPDDHAAIAALQTTAYSSMRIVPDATVQPGGCLVQSELGTIEAGVAVQLEELTAMLLDNDVPLADEGRPRAESSAA
jgi:flagellar assembly protein FliH